MRTLAVLMLAITTLLGGGDPAAAFDLGDRAPAKPADHHAYVPPAAPRQGGDTLATSIPITIPGVWTGTTAGYADDLDEACPYSGSTAPDVVYRVTTAADVAVDIDLCYSSYDTKVYVYDEDLALVACNDDFHDAEPCYSYSSKLEDLPLQALATYYVVIDGYGSAAGEYQLEITEHVPCVLSCDGGWWQQEGEPPLADGYVDQHNGGCNSPEAGSPFQDISSEYFCGRSGWYVDPDGATRRDTDWFRVIMPSAGFLEITGEAEVASHLFELGPQDCGDVAVIQSVVFGPCSPNTLTISGPPGSVVWLWVGPTTTLGPVQEYTYQLELQLGGGDWQYSRLVIDPRPQGLDAPWELVIPSGTVITGAGYNDDLAAGVGPYTLTWLDLPGWFTPDPAEVSGTIAYEFWDLLQFVGEYRLGLPYSADFDAGEAPHFTPLSGSWLVTGGRYTCSNDLPGTRFLTTVGNLEWADYRVAVDIEVEGTLWRELIFRYVDPDSYYRLLVRPAPWHRAELWKHAEGQEILLHAQDGVSDPGGAVQRLEAGVSGAAIHASLDGQHLFAVTDDDTPWLTGGIALSAHADPGFLWQVASYDNLEVVAWDDVTAAPIAAGPGARPTLSARPNPFNPSTTVHFELPHRGEASLAVHDLRGRRVRTLSRGLLAAGSHLATWDGLDDAGAAAPSGIYVVRLVASDGLSLATKITLAK